MNFFNYQISNFKLLKFIQYVILYIVFRYVSSKLRSGFLNFNSTKKINFGDIEIKEGLLHLLLFSYLMSFFYKLLHIEKNLDSIITQIKNHF